MAYLQSCTPGLNYFFHKCLQEVWSLPGSMPGAGAKVVSFTVRVATFW